MIVHSSDGVFAIRKGPWKWIEGVPVDGYQGRRKEERTPTQFGPQLYNTRTRSRRDEGRQRGTS